MKTVNLLVILLLIVLSIGTFVLYRWNKSIGDYSHPIAEDSISHCYTNFNINKKELGRRIIDLQLDYGCLSDLVITRGKPILILRIKETDCSVCVMNELKNLNSYKDVLINDVLVLGSYTSERTLRVLLKRKNLNIISHNIPFNFFEHFSFEVYNSPYYFILDPNLKISNIYIPDQMFSNMTKEYLDGVVRLLENN